MGSKWCSRKGERIASVTKGIFVVEKKKKNERKIGGAICKNVISIIRFFWRGRLGGGNERGQ